MNNCPPQPNCTDQAGQNAPPDVFDVWVSYLTILSGAGTGISLIGAALGGAATAATAIVTAGIGASIATVALVWSYYYVLCQREVSGPKACASGIVERAVITPEDPTNLNLFPFTRMHPWVDLVIGCQYWPLVEEQGRTWIECSNGPDKSPILRCVFKSDRLCAALLGALLGAAAAAVIIIIIALAVAPTRAPMKAPREAHGELDRKITVVIKYMESKKPRIIRQPR